MRFFGRQYVRKTKGVRAWWRRLRCRVWYGEHEFKSKPTQLYHVKCGRCDDQLHVFDIPVPPMTGQSMQECPHCHNVAYGKKDQPYRCYRCGRESQEGAGKVVAINYR